MLVLRTGGTGSGASRLMVYIALGGSPSYDGPTEDLAWVVVIFLSHGLRSQCGP